MAIMDLFTSLQTIVNERSAKKVRQSIHDGIFRANQVVDANKNLVDQVSIRQDAVEDFNNQVIQEMTDRDVISAPEIIEARGGKPTLSARFDDTEGQITQIEINPLDFGAVGDGVTDDSQALNESIDRAVMSGGRIKIPKGFVFKVSINKNVSDLKIIGGGTLSSAGGVDLLTLTGDRNSVTDVEVLVDTSINIPVNLIGNNNVIDGAKVYRPVKLPVGSSISYVNTLIKASGDFNIIRNCETFNGWIGIQTQGRYNQIIYNYVHDNVIGVHQPSRNRKTVIDNNIILNNNVSNASGADGILATRNVSGLKITRNTILNSGEHGIYFQGDSSVITDNIVNDNHGSGIKLASYTDGLYFYDDEAEEANYTGHSNVISRNICKGNGLTGVNSGIYLQSPLDNITVTDNVTDDNAFGIRSVTTGGEIKNLTVANNQAHGNTEYDYSLVCHLGLMVSGNSGGRMDITGGTGPMGVEPTISGNNLTFLYVNNQNFPRIINNTSDDMIINTNNVRAVVKGNTIRKLKTLHLDRIRDFIENTINFDENGKITSSPYGQIDNFSRNTLSFKPIDYPDAINFGSGTRTGLKFDDNTFTFDGLSVPAILIYINFSSMTNNSFLGTITTQSIANIRGNNNNISGNRSNTTVEIGMVSGTGNIFTNNQMTVGYAGTLGIKANNKA